jgi:radical SAM protein with 4Fe4S-binding SPASM domain
VHLKIKEYLETDPETKEKLRSIATFFTSEQMSSANGGEQLSPLDEERVSRILGEAEKVARGEIAYPSIVRIGLTTSCLHNCSGCHFANSRTKEKLFMDSDNFRTLLNALHSLKVDLVDLSGGGEPTLHPEFKALVNMFIDDGFKLAFLSNGTWTDPDIVDFISDRFSFIRINMDASSGKVYDRIHHPASPDEFQRLLGNLEGIVEGREKGKTGLIIGGKVWISQDNMNFLEVTTNLARDLGLDYIQFQIRRDSPESLTSEQVRSVDQLIRELKHKFRSFLIYRESEEGETPDRCWASNLRLTIDPEGNIYSCPFYPDQLDSVCLGNIFSQPVDKLWLDSEHKSDIDRQRMKVCSSRDCRWHVYDKILRRRIKTRPGY